MPRRKPQPAVPRFTSVRPNPAPVVTERFGEPWIDPPSRDEPSTINGLTIRRYRVTVELIDEPDDVLAERLRKLWRETRYNHHLNEGFKAAAADLGITLHNDERGIDAQR